MTHSPGVMQLRTLGLHALQTPTDRVVAARRPVDDAVAGLAELAEPVLEISPVLTRGSGLGPSAGAGAPRYRSSPPTMLCPIAGVPFN